MPDREKVIKGLECCHNKNMLWQHDQCPYHGFDEDCESNLHADALALLKEQEKQNGKCVNECECWDAAYERGKQDTLNEQEAVTIKKTKEHGFGVYGGICPKCRNWIQSAHSFCGFCGQAVKWE